MHIETELDDVYAERLLELQKHANKPLPQLVAEMLAKAINERPAPLVNQWRTARITPCGLYCQRCEAGSTACGSGAIEGQ